MRRFKLANGGVIASCKQPLQNIDFDRIEITDNYEQWYDNNGTFDDYGGPPFGQITFTIRLYNPSTHTIRKSYCKSPMSRPMLVFGTKMHGHVGGSHSSKQAFGGDHLYLSNLAPGCVVNFTVSYPVLAAYRTHYEREVNPFDSLWYDEDNEVPDNPNLDPYQNYYHDEYEVGYTLRLIGSPRNKLTMTNRIHIGGGCRRTRDVDYSITYYIH